MISPAVKNSGRRKHRQLRYRKYRVDMQHVSQTTRAGRGRIDSGIADEGNALDFAGNRCVRCLRKRSGAFRSARLSAGVRSVGACVVGYLRRHANADPGKRGGQPLRSGIDPRLYPAIFTGRGSANSPYGLEHRKLDDPKPSAREESIAGLPILFRAFFSSNLRIRR